jgi:hypothetical protein
MHESWTHTVLLTLVDLPNRSLSLALKGPSTQFMTIFLPLGLLVFVYHYLCRIRERRWAQRYLIRGLISNPHS